MNRQRILQTTCLVAATLLMAACTQDELADADGHALPEGKYPMTFTTAVEELTVTRAATADGQWTVGDRIAVRVGTEGVKQYTPAAGGSSSTTLQAASGVEPFYWQTSGEKKTVSAWYLGTGYNATLPATWTVKSNQNANDGYQQSDFLYAPATTISFADRNSTSLKFYHQTAKVVINIVNAEAATSAGQIRSVVIGNNNNIALSGSYAAPGTGQTAGTWSNNTTGTGTITPKSITAASGYLKSYAALVIPQDMTNKQFIAVTLTDGSTYYYTPKNSDGNLLSGKQHTYNITVKNGYLEVTAGTSVSWGDSDIGGGSTTTEATSFRVTLSGSSLPALSDLTGITDKGSNKYETSGNTFSFNIPKDGRKGFLIQGGLADVARQESGDKIIYTFTNVRSDLVLGYYDNLPQVGDYYYADGTCSAEYKSGPPACIGIVFKVNAGTGDAVSNYDGKLPDGFIRGYVAALTNAASDGKPAWSTEKVNTGVSTSKTDFNGYRNTRIIMARSNYGTQYPAFVSCVSNNGTAAPASSSGWYMPSCAQIKALHEIRGSIGSKFSAAGGTVLSSPSDYWTSNESAGKQANYVWHYHTNGDGSLWDDTQKTEFNKDYVRAILTF